MKGDVKPILTDVINPCKACGKPDSETHQRWCGVETKRYVRQVRARVDARGITDYYCTGCLSLVPDYNPEHPDKGCTRCSQVDQVKKEAAATFFVKKAEEKKQLEEESFRLRKEAKKSIRETKKIDLQELVNRKNEELASE